MATPENQKAAVDEQQAVYDADYEDSLKDLLLELENRVVYGFSIAEENRDERQAEAVSRIDRLCAALGIRQDVWAEAFISGHMIGTGRSSIDSEVAWQAHLDGQTIGRFVTSLAWRSLSIENDDEGEGSVEVALRCVNEHALRLRAEGYFSTEYQKEDVELGWRITYEADIEPTKL
jgi:hypothetical protein